MPGIFGTNIKNNKAIMSRENRLYKKLRSSDFYLELSGIKKFENDKGLFENDSYILLMDGVILNLSYLKQKYKQDNLFDTVISMYQSNVEFFNDFRGCFCGFFKDKKNNKSLIFTNHFGDKMIFYYLNKDNIIFASEIKDIITVMNDNNIDYNIDKASIYSMLTYGYMYNDITPIKEVKRLIPGSYILIENGKFSIRRYYVIKNKMNDKCNEKEAIEEMDRKFRHAMQMQIDKNAEYGYENYSPLSAGLDSRMTNYVLRDLYDGDIYNMTYSETGQLDEIIPAKIARELKNHWLFKNLDNGLALKRIKESFEFTGGVIYFLWPVQLFDYMKLVNTDKMGIVHTGVFGDATPGTYFKDGIIKSYKLGAGGFSNKLIDKLKKYLEETEYDNHEIGVFYNRGCNGVVLGYSLTFQRYTECMSPFMDVDFFNYCLTLPLEYRFQHNIYYKWVSSCYRNAAKYPHNLVKIPSSKSPRIHYKNKKYPIDTLFSRVKAVLKSKFDSKADMNPIQFWYDNNSDLKKIIDNYYNENIKKVEDSEIKSDMMLLYKDGTAMEKMQVVSALSIISNYSRGKL